MNVANLLGRRFFDALASLRLAVPVMTALGTTCLFATLYESKHGTAAVQRDVYRTGWFTAILVLLGINIFCAMMSRYPWKKHHAGFVMAHIGILLLLAGSLVSLHYGFDGNMAVFEGETTDSVALLEKAVEVHLPDGNRRRIGFDFEKSPPRAGRPRTFSLDDAGTALVVEDFHAHVGAKETFEAAATGNPALHFVLDGPFADGDGWLVANDSERHQLSFGPASFDFHVTTAAHAHEHGAGERNHLAFWLRPDGTLGYTVSSRRDASSRQGEVTLGRAIETPWMGMKVTVDRFHPRAAGRQEVAPETPPVKDERRIPALRVRLEGRGARSEAVWVRWTDAVHLPFGGGDAVVLYRAPELHVPFKVKLLDFKSDKYPGSSMAATYESFVRVDDPERGVSEHHISMNHPLHYRGYIFFQASFVEGEPMMSIFSVARSPGLPMVYIGTTLIAAGIVWMFYVKPYLARRQAAAALAAHQAKHEREPKTTSSPAAPPQPASGRA